MTFDNAVGRVFLEAFFSRGGLPPFFVGHIFYLFREDFFPFSYFRLWGFLLHLSYYLTLSSARFNPTHLAEVRCIIIILICFFLSGLLFSFGKKYSGGVSLASIFFPPPIFFFPVSFSFFRFGSQGSCREEVEGRVNDVYVAILLRTCMCM